MRINGCGFAGNSFSFFVREESGKSAEGGYFLFGRITLLRGIERAVFFASLAGGLAACGVNAGVVFATLILALTVCGLLLLLIKVTRSVERPTVTSMDMVLGS